MDKVQAIPYIDIQHDALAVLDDVEQGIVLQETVWISGYQLGCSSVHGKIRLEAREGGGIKLIARDGVKVDMASRTRFLVDIPSLGINQVPVCFPRQVLSPPYTKATSFAPELHINSIAYSERAGQLVVGGSDGYCIVLSPTESLPPLELKGHVGDILSVRWFPSGKVILTSSSDLSIRIFSSSDGVNPRTLRGHTRAITATHILGVGKQVLSASKDGSVRLWDVGRNVEVKKWLVEGKRYIEALAVVEDDTGKRAFNVEDPEDKVILTASPDGTLSAFLLSSQSLSPPFFSRLVPVSSRLVSLAYAPGAQLIATGHTDGTIAILQLQSLCAHTGEAVEGNQQLPVLLIKRNESPIYSLLFVESNGNSDILVGTASGLPCRLSVTTTDEDMSVEVKEEYAGWEATGIETWTVSPDSVWCAGGEGGIRRY